jgi:DNA-binding GntR family transcriptional regulator
MAGRSPLDDALEPASLVQLCTVRLRDEILSGALQPGERLVEEHLTRRFRISRAPLREAMRLLDQQGLVEHLPRRGVRVAQLSERDVDELFSLRDVLERYAVGLAMPLGDTGRLGELTKALDDMADAAAGGDALAENDAHCRFHIALVGLADHRQLTLAFESVILKLQLYMAANLRREAEHRGARDDGVLRHRRLFDAVTTGGPEAVLQALATHGARAFIG